MDTQTNGIYLTLITSLGFLTLLLVLIIVSLLRHQRQRLKDYQGQVFREIELIDRERERISADLHDELGTGLSAIGLLLQQAGKGKEAVLEKAMQQVRKQQEKLKEISHNLVPRILESHGLAIALLDLCEDIRMAGNISVTPDLSIDDRRFRPAKSIHIYRIIREIMINTLKHAGAGEIQLVCIQDERKLSILIGDNGKGFDRREQFIQPRGSGLQNIRTRIELLGASLSVGPAKQSGTRYEIKVPLSAM